MNKNLLYGALVVIVIIVFTLIWKNSEKSREVEAPNVVIENKAEVLPTETAASISNDVNNIQVDSGIDADLKALDTDVGTL